MQEVSIQLDTFLKLEIALHNPLVTILLSQSNHIRSFVTGVNVALNKLKVLLIIFFFKFKFLGNSHEWLGKHIIQNTPETCE